jgi:hypothetical protein
MRLDVVDVFADVERLVGQVNLRYRARGHGLPSNDKVKCIEISIQMFFLELYLSSGCLHVLPLNGAIAQI